MGYSFGGRTREICLDPVFPLLRAPVIVDPEESALQQIFAEAGDFLLRQFRGAHVFHVKRLAVEQIVVGEPDRQVIGLAVRPAAHARLRELRQPDRKVDVRVWIIRRPAHAARFQRTCVYMPRQNVKPPSKLSGVGSRNGARPRRMKFCAPATRPPDDEVSDDKPARNARHCFLSSFFAVSAGFSGPFESDL